MQSDSNDLELGYIQAIDIHEWILRHLFIYINNITNNIADNFIYILTIYKTKLITDVYLHSHFTHNFLNCASVGVST